MYLRHPFAKWERPTASPDRLAFITLVTQHLRQRGWEWGTFSERGADRADEASYNCTKRLRGRLPLREQDIVRMAKTFGLGGKAYRDFLRTGLLVTASKGMRGPRTSAAPSIGDPA